MEPEKSEQCLNLLFLGQSRVGKTSLIHNFAHHFHSKHFSEERLSLTPSKSQDSQQTSIFMLENESRKLRMIDTSGPQVGFSEFHKLDNIFDNIISELSNFEDLHGIILVINPSTRKDKSLESFLTQITEYLPQDIQSNFFVICTKNTGKVESEIREVISEMLKFTPDKRHWFALDNKCLKPYEDFDEDEQELVQRYWKVGEKTFNTIHDKIISTYPIQISYLRRSQETKRKLHIVLRDLDLKRKELFLKVRDELDLVHSKETSQKDKIPSQIRKNSKMWTCKDCRRCCSTRTRWALVFKMVASCCCWPFTFLTRIFASFFRCKECECPLAKHTDDNHTSDSEVLIRKSHEPNQERSVDILAMVNLHLSDHLSEIVQLMKTTDAHQSACLEATYLNHLSGKEDAILDNQQPNRDLVDMMLRIIASERGLFKDLTRRASQNYI